MPDLTDKFAMSLSQQMIDIETDSDIAMRSDDLPQLFSTVAQTAARKILHRNAQTVFLRGLRQFCHRIGRQRAP